eukprot:11955863-Karenia_brevis.AAC.1
MLNELVIDFAILTYHPPLALAFQCLDERVHLNVVHLVQANEVSEQLLLNHEKQTKGTQHHLVLSKDRYSKFRRSVPLA